MSNDAMGNVAVHQSLTKPRSKLKRINPQLDNTLVDIGNQRKRAKGAKGSPVRRASERSLEPYSEWLVQNYGTLKPSKLDVPVLHRESNSEQVGKYLRAVQWLYATMKFVSLKKPSVTLAARHVDCSYCNCACAARKKTKCLHCQFYPNSHAARCYDHHGMSCGNLAYILRHLPGYKVAGPEMIGAVRAAFKKRPLEYEHNDGEGGYVLGSSRMESAHSTFPTMESAGLLEPNFVASVFSGYEGYLLLLHDGGQLQGYGSTEEYASLVESRLLPVYREPEVLHQKVRLPPVVQLGDYRAEEITRFFHYQTICWADHVAEVFTNWGLDVTNFCYMPRALMRGPKMNLGCNPIPLLSEHQYIQIALTQTSSNMPMEANGLSRRMVKDLKDPCPCHPPCKVAESPRLLTYFIIDRNEDEEPLRTVTSGYIRFGPEDRKILVDLFL